MIKLLDIISYVIIIISNSITIVIIIIRSIIIIHTDMSYEFEFEWIGRICRNNNDTDNDDNDKLGWDPSLFLPLVVAEQKPVRVDQTKCFIWYQLKLFHLIYMYYIYI